MSWMVDEIEARGGEVPFEVFMELALYHQQYGYYTCEEPRYGRLGDYLTAPTASAWYARMLARLLRVIAADVGPLRLIDVASGDGAVIGGILDELGTGAVEVLGEVISVERSTPMRARQRHRLVSKPLPIQWIAAASEVEPSTVATVIHASELYDALPVARVMGGRAGISELVVAVSAGELEWRRRPPRTEVAAYFERHGVEIQDEQIAEVNLAAEKLHAVVLEAARDGGVALTLDYGYEARRLYDPRGRRGGSLTTFRDHRFGRDPLETPGRVDLTTHVNWDDLRSAADGCGWQEIGLWQLAEFLILGGLADELEARGLGIEAELDASTVAERQEIKRLLDPEGMGSDLKVLVQAKGDMIGVARKALSLD
jgi:SAM-dependent MidA family methyltransferase